MDLYDDRREFSRGNLKRADLSNTPEPLFEQWLQAAEAMEIDSANAMSLATVDKKGQPFQRTVLLKSIDASGLVFFCNLTSRKSQQIEDNHQVSLLFFWAEMERQVHFVGSAKNLSPSDNAEYFLSRPRESQLAALASHQSQVIDSRENLIDRYNALEKKYPNDIPAPDFWGGYKVDINSVEFWQGGSHRLHDRFLYTKNKNNSWHIDRLAP